MAPILAYWDIRGLAASIRYLLEYAGVEYEDKLYKCGPPPTFDRSEWLDEKFTLGLDFPNLPYYIDGDVKLTQSSVILRHLANEHGLLGKTKADQHRVELICAQVTDYHMDLVRIAYNPQFHELKGEYAKNMPSKLEMLTKFLGERKFVAGDYVTYADFVFAEYLAGQLNFDAEILKDFPSLKEYHDRVFALEAIDKYLKSPRGIKYPFNGAPAYFGGQFSDQLFKSE